LLSRIGRALDVSAVTLDNVVKNYGDVVAVDFLTLDIRNKEFVVLLGPSARRRS
jgi:multiple sugar transport system ATP-binding protein